MTEYVCKACGSTVDYLEVFPGPLCLSCYSHTDEAMIVRSAADIRRMWGMQ